MTGYLDSIPEFISNISDLNLYYIFPFIFACVVFYVQSKKGNTNFIILLFSCSGIFSITTSFEYILIFLFTESLPESIASFDKIILGFGTLIVLLVIFRHTTEGTWIGNWTDNILNKYVIPNPTPMPISPFMEPLEKLRSLRENIMTGDEHQVNNAHQVFLEIGSSIRMSLTKNCPVNSEDVPCIQTLYDSCKKNFEDLCDSQIVSDREKTAGSLSEFIGSVDGFTKQSK